MLQPTTLREILAIYRLRHFNLAERTHRFYAIYHQGFERWYGGQVPLQALSDDLILNWLSDERAFGHAARTVNGKRMAVLVLWKEACKLGVLKKEPGKIPRMKEPRRAATSWSIQDVGRILRHCKAASSEGWPASKKSWSTAHWQSLVLIIYDTSLRINPLLSLPRGCVDTRRRTLLVPGAFQKNGQDILHRLHPQTCGFIDQMPWHSRLFPWPKNVTDIWTDFRRILIAADLPHSYRDLFHKLRRTSYTQVFKGLGLEGASEHAGHSGDLSAIYLDKTQLDLPSPIDVLPRPTL